MIQVIAFDVFGTVFDLRQAERDDVRDYAQHIRQPVWRPLHLPTSWERLPAHPDSAAGIARLRTKFFVVTCSNGPLGLLAKMSKNAGIQWDAIIPLELSRAYKPEPAAYLTVCNVLAVAPAQVMLVTANKTFGDLEGSAALGMTPVLIRDTSLGGPATIPELASQLGC